MTIFFYIISNNTYRDKINNASFLGYYINSPTQVELSREAIDLRHNELIRELYDTSIDVNTIEIQDSTLFSSRNENDSIDVELSGQSSPLDTKILKENSLMKRLNKYTLTTSDNSSLRTTSPFPMLSVEKSSDLDYRVAMFENTSREEIDSIDDDSHHQQNPVELPIGKFNFID